MSERMTNFEKIVQGGAEALAELFDKYLKLPDATIYCVKGVNCRLVGDCRNCFIAWLNSPAEPAKPKLTEDEEIELRAAVRIGLPWAAREESGELALYADKPEKGRYGEWRFSGPHWIYYKGKERLDLIQWSDPEPVYLPDLLGDYK